MKNQPIKRIIKKTENGLLRADASLSRILFRVTERLSKHNEKHNIRGRTITDQSHGTGGLFLGKYPLSHNGCEIIAVHNANLLVKKNDLSISEHIDRFVKEKAVIGGFLFRGFFGSNPFSICRVLDNEKIPYERVDISFLSRAGIYIVSYWNDLRPLSPLHTVAVRIIENGDRIVLNGSPEMFDDDCRFICGYRIIDKP